MNDLMEKIISYYTEKLDAIKVEFGIDEYSNCLLRGDLDRAIEVLQNIMENANGSGCSCIRARHELTQELSNSIRFRPKNWRKAK